MIQVSPNVRFTTMSGCYPSPVARELAPADSTLRGPDLSKVFNLLNMVTIFGVKACLDNFEPLVLRWWKPTSILTKIKNTNGYFVDELFNAIVDFLTKQNLDKVKQVFADYCHSDPNNKSFSFKIQIVKNRLSLFDNE